MKQFKFIWRFLKGNRLKSFGILVVVMFYVSMTLIAPLLFGFLIDNVINLKPLTNPVLIAFSSMLGGVPYIRTHI
ncbi:MAG: hypothetical protein E4G74_02235, partial [Erysipelotrichales bacterium]